MNLGDLTVSFSIKVRTGLPDRQPQARCCRTRAASGAKAECRGGIAKRRITKCGETAGEKSEHLVVPVKQGNRFHLDPAEGRRCRVTDLLGGNMPSASELDYVSTKQQQIAKLAKQSPQMCSSKRVIPYSKNIVQ